MASYLLGNVAEFIATIQGTEEHKKNLCPQKNKALALTFPSSLWAGRKNVDQKKN